MTNLREQYEKETKELWINSQGEPDIDYVEWLEKRCKFMEKQIRMHNREGAIECFPLKLKDKP